jgi:hypothetical protein
MEARISLKGSNSDRELSIDASYGRICGRRLRGRMLVAVVSLCIGLGGTFTSSWAAETDAHHKKPKPTPCTQLISKCGCTITTTGFYQVTKDLGLPGQSLNAADQSCIAVDAPRVGLSLIPTVPPFTLLKITNALTTGGIGIHLNSSATSSFIEGGGVTLAGWSYGIEDDADKVTVTNLTADNNSTAGIYVQSATSVTIANFGAHANGQYGVELSGAVLSQVSGGGIKPLANPGVQNNGTAGIEVTGSPNIGNRIFGNCVTDNLGAGIILDVGASNSKVTGNEVTGNQHGDLLDNNDDCGSNLWFGNLFDGGLPIPCTGPSLVPEQLSICPQ